MVVKQCSIIAPRLATSTCSPAVIFCEGNSAWVTTTPRNFKRHGIKTAHAVIERDRAKRPDAGDRFGDHFGALISGRVVRLQHKTPQLVGQKFLGQIQIVDAACDHVRSDVNLQVVACFNGLPSGIGYAHWCNSGFSGHGTVALLIEYGQLLLQRSRAVSSDSTPSETLQNKGAGLPAISLRAKGRRERPKGSSRNCSTAREGCNRRRADRSACGLRSLRSARGRSECGLRQVSSRGRPLPHRFGRENQAIRLPDP